MTRKVSLIFVAVALLLTGCSYNSGRVQLFNWNLFGTPDTVVVQRGDTLYSIARRYNIPIRNLIEINHLQPPYTLRIGQQLRMPGTNYHTVAKGDTLYNISKRYNVDVTSLSRMNNLQPPYTLAIGQRLALPGSVSGGSSLYTSTTKTSTSSGYSFWKSSSTPKKTTTTKTASAKRSTPVTTKRKSKFAWPVKGTIISKYGTIGKGRNNDGINIKAALGTAVKAADGGRVAYAGNELKGFGNLILIKHNDGWVTAYAHNDRLFVKKGQTVRKGEKIAAVGSTGSVNSPQLHFEIRSGKKALNPLSYLP